MPSGHRPHRRALTVLYADLESYALNQREVFVGTRDPSSAAGFRFYTHLSYDSEARSASGISPDWWTAPRA